MTTFIVAGGSPLPRPHNDSPARELQKFLLSDWMQSHLMGTAELTILPQTSCFNLSQLASSISTTATATQEHCNCLLKASKYLCNLAGKYIYANWCHMSFVHICLRFYGSKAILSGPAGGVVRLRSINLAKAHILKFLWWTLGEGTQ